MVWAAYPNKDYNVKYAISNKFFESLVYEKPTFFSKEINAMIKRSNRLDTSKRENPWAVRFLCKFSVKVAYELLC